MNNNNNCFSQEPKRLTRCSQNKKIFGICGGIGKYFGWDPSLVRIAFVIFLILGGSGILLYLVLLLVMPNEIT
ncbi:MAG: PspC domain-containing protein [Defluviitaleaceae bacterium]|nr:PspC domain-containing protein [Defluviitaleaceae bacterium]